jgi:hypothetical protein
MKSEHLIQNEIQLALSSENSCVFRTNAGTFYQGKLVYSKEFGQRVLINVRTVKGLPEGFSDLIYYGADGDCAFIEVKRRTGAARTAQERFLNRMRQLGHKAGIARSVDDARAIVDGLPMMK